MMATATADILKGFMQDIAHVDPCIGGPALMGTASLTIP